MALKVLYIDDELDLLDIAATFFEEESIPIDICSDIGEALELVKNNSYDLIISDANLPSGSGQDFCRMIKREGLHKGKTILVTGNIEKYGDKPGQEFDLVIYKPIRFQELVEQVKKILNI